MEKAPTALTKKLVEVMKAVENVPKLGRNEFHGYDYVREEDILRAVRGKLADLGVLMTTSIESTSRHDTLSEVTTKHTFIDAETGETLEVKGYGQGLDKSDKGGPKAITSAVKYALLKTFLIPTGDDPERENPELDMPKGKPPKNPNGRQGPPESTAQQQQQIKTMAAELGLDVDRDILARMQISWPPVKKDADRILQRLHELKREKARR